MAVNDPNPPDWWTTQGQRSPSFDQVNSDYQTYLGRTLTQAEYQQYWANKTNYSSTDVSGTPEAQAHQQSLTTIKPLAPGDPGFDPNVNNPTTWTPGASAPNETYAGWTWDPKMARYVQGAPAAAPPPTTDGGTTGGSSTGGSSAGSGAAAPGWSAPAGPPSSGFGAAPPPYASSPDAPQFAPLPAYQAPLWTGGDFVNPSEEDLKSAPGYQARLDQLIKTKTRQAAAQGTVLNGGTLTALDRAGQDYASNEYQTYRNNALDAYKARYSQFQDAAGMNLAARTLNANENQATFANRTSTYNTSNARTLSDYLTNVTAQRNAELDYWNRLKDVNNTGADLAGSSYKAP